MGNEPNQDNGDLFPDLRMRAEEVIGRLNGTDRRPVFVEFSGSPKSGKSSCIDTVAHFFRRLDFRVFAPTEGASRRTPYYLKKDWVSFNTWSASYALMHVLEGLHDSEKYHLAILDRGLFDALAWFELLSLTDQITQAERDHVHQFLLISKWRSVIDAVLLFQADPETSLQRENREKLINEPGSAMNPEVLQLLNGAYEQVRTRYSIEFPRFRTIDTSNAAKTTPRSTAAEVAGMILEVFESPTTLQLPS